MVGRWEDAKLEAKRYCLRHALDIFIWVKCFVVYPSVYGAQFPEMISELVAHTETKIKIVNTLDHSWSTMYDMLFCKHAPLRKGTRWSVINATIYARCLQLLWETHQGVRCVWSPHMTPRNAAKGTLIKGTLKVDWGTQNKHYSICPQPHCGMWSNSQRKSAEVEQRGVQLSLLQIYSHM